MNAPKNYLAGTKARRRSTGARQLAEIESALAPLVPGVMIPNGTVAERVKFLARELTVADEIIRTLRAEAGANTIAGTIVEAGDGPSGESRLIIQVPRASLESLPRNVIYSQCTVSLNTHCESEKASRDAASPATAYETEDAFYKKAKKDVKKPK